jgi:hypothetical protein
MTIIGNRRINGKAVKSTGLPAIAGLETPNTFTLVTDTKDWISKNVEMAFASGKNVSQDYMSNYNHRPQFSLSAGTTLVDGNSYNNSWIPKSAQMIAPADCYLKRVYGYLNTGGCASVEESFTIIISIWSKPVTVDGTANTAVKLLFQQEIGDLMGKANAYTQAIDGSTDSRVGDSSYLVNQNEGIMATIRCETGAEIVPCAFRINFEMTFETIDGQTITTSDFILPSIATSRMNRYTNVLSQPNRQNIKNSNSDFSSDTE